MKFLEELWDAIKGNTVARVKDPIIGTFVISWLVCNWYEISLLFWGDGKSWERLNRFHSYLGADILNNYILVIVSPIIITILYLFAFPWVSFFVKKLQLRATSLLFKQAIDIEIKKVNEQLELNKIRLKSNPDKDYLSELVKIDIDNEKFKTEQLAMRTEIFKNAIEISKAKAQVVRDEALQSQINTQVKVQKQIIDKEKFEIISTRNQSAIASERFPSAYSLIKKLSIIIEEDEIILPFDCYGEIVSMIFGYENFGELISNEKFNNNVISKLKYVYFNNVNIINELEMVIENSNLNKETISSDSIFEYLQILFDELPYELVSVDDLANIVFEELDINRFDLLQNEDLSGVMAETDTIFEDIDIYKSELTQINDQEVLVTVYGKMSGYHRNESSVPGQSINFQVIMSAPIILGRYGLREFQVQSATGSVNYD